MTGTERRNIETIRRVLAAFAAGDIETVRALLLPDAEVRFPAAGVFKGQYKGIAEIFEFFGQFHRETNGTGRIDLEELAASNNLVFALVNETAERKGKSISARQVFVYTLDDGRIAALHAY
jgi:ketosteroid isomerase-like protein